MIKAVRPKAISMGFSPASLPLTGQTLFVKASDLGVVFVNPSPMRGRGLAGPVL